MQDTSPLNQEKSQFVRKLTRTKDDFERLARCYNSFKDPESWPGGFGGTRIFTGEFIEKEMKAQDLEGHFVAIAPDDPDKIVGVCFIGKSWNSPNSYYVQFLGVDPAYQGQKLGKAMLLHATDYVTKLKALLLSLHTWGGNLKAMPLYKRQGYKWRPNTSVYMENYLPQILNYPYFQEFFSNLSKSWYECFVPKITQEPDTNLDDQMQIYEYEFQDQDQRLVIWVDRSIGKISGFHLKTTTEDILIQGKISNSHGFIGSEEFPINLRFTNNSETDLNISYEVEPTPKIKLLNSKMKNQIKIPNSLSKSIEVQGSFLVDTNELDTKIHTHTLTEHGIIFKIKHKNQIFPLTVGKIPVKAIKVDPYPTNFATIPENDVTIPLTLQNNIGEETHLVVSVKDGNNISFKKHREELILGKYDSTVKFNASTQSTGSVVDWFEIEIRSTEDKLLTKETIPIMIFNKNKSLYYERDQQIFIENKHIRITLFTESQPGSNEVFITDKLRKLQVFGLPIVLGYPFDVEGSEFYSKKHTHETRQDEGGVWLLSSSTSDLKSGIEVTRRIYLPNEGDFLSVEWEVRNNSEKVQENLGVVNHTYWWPSTISLLSRVLPLKSGVKELDILAFPIDLGKEPSMYSEGWQAAVYKTGAFGVFFDQENIDKITIGRAQPNIDIKVPNLAVGEYYLTEPIYLTFADNWQTIRKKWKEQYQPSPINEVEYSRVASSLKQIGLRNSCEGNTIAYGAFLDRNNHNLELSIDTFRETSFKGSMELTMGKLGSDLKIDLPEEKGQYFNRSVDLDIPEEEQILEGMLSIDSLTRIFEYPVALGIFDTSQNVTITHTADSDVYEVSNSVFTFRGSEKYRGNVFHLSLDGKKENLLHTGSAPFPEVKPFLWFHQFFGGIGPVLQPEGLRDVENFNTLIFKYYQPSAGKWKGIGFKSSIIEYSPKIKGLQIATEYLTLPNSPFLLVQTHVYNHSDIIRKFSLQIEGKMKTTGTSKDFYFIDDIESPNHYLKYRLQDWEALVWLEKGPQPKWCAYKNENCDFYMAAVIPTVNMNEYAYPYAPNLKIIMLDLITNSEQILPQQMLTFRMLYFFTDSLESVHPFTQSNLLDLFPEQQRFPVD